MSRHNRKRSFFEKLTGTINVDDDYDDYEEEVEEGVTITSADSSRWVVGEPVQEEGELSVDMYQNPEAIIIQAMIAGVRPDDLDISITREMVTITGRREAPRGIEDKDYFHRELYWGSFTRTLMLPAEVEVEECEAVANHGLLILRLPKINKQRETKLKVKVQ